MPSTFTAFDVVRLARGRHIAFDEQAHPDEVAFDFLDSYQRELAQRMMLVDDELLVASLVTTLPLGTFSNGITLPAHTFIKGAWFRWASATNDIALNLVPWEHRFEPTTFPFASIHGAALILGGEAVDWSNIVSVTVSYMPEISAITAKGDLFILPDMAKPALIAALAVFFGERQAAIPDGLKVNLQGLYAAAGRAEATLLDVASMRRRAEADYVREVI